MFKTALSIPIKLLKSSSNIVEIASEYIQALSSNSTFSRCRPFFFAFCHQDSSA